MRTSELDGLALDWAVSLCEGIPVDDLNACVEGGWVELDGEIVNWGLNEYSNSWAFAGPIIELERIGIITIDGTSNWRAFSTHNKPWAQQCHREGPSPLIAAMRYYVASKLGDEVEIPEELK